MRDIGLVMVRAMSSLKAEQPRGREEAVQLSLVLPIPLFTTWRENDTYNIGGLYHV
jgi:hypothetical protein